MEIDSTMQTPITNNREGFSSMSNFADAGLQFGIGFSYNDLGSGIDMRTENFGLQMDTGLTSGLSHAVFLFVRSKMTLVMNQNGVQVIN
jgi:citrate lyase beta subunit